MWEYDFMRYALLAGIMIAITCGIVSVFVILRRCAFAAHALGHMSLTGAALSGLIGIPLILGQLLLNLIAAIIMGLLGEKIKKNDLIVGVVLSFMMGMGVYFLYLYQNNYATGVMSILFGNILAISMTQLKILFILTLTVLAVFLIIARPLLFSSLDLSLAIAKNMPLKILAIIFFMILALTVTMACQIVGALLVFVLLIIPGAIALQWVSGFYLAVIISISLSIFSIVAALILAYNFNLPISFCITMILCLSYAIYPVKSLLNRIN